ncbi:hypothetical protein TVAG_228370 [Trichomonas vaginalis G3]|uniref:Uncharacterized protein n=1 Tax=Trichomonas vaginalis (strain ATCC PRA-98 / G3) TaxID=412133 RepID=A2DIZ9_TRIV3|nr:hypothetical protein TVAGG3_0483880 [Trichomonas vaginalis G3]EAY19574.1 hypothetical protein TVAG_228370 [Trichomonas vaginalis G3]KAI5515903.1 hypothetical protein TVAGG3_0483880 [Trichomonas vaginalis G3]|eukprot:XP_001580560.1 hypothetical protein [Trichomonas vaginalis G3]
MNKYIDYRIVQNDSLNEDFIERGRIHIKIKLDVSFDDIEGLSGSMADRCIIVVINNKLDSFIIVRNYNISRENNPHLPKSTLGYSSNFEAAAAAIVTIKNKFDSVEELLYAVAGQKDFKLDYSIGTITLVRNFLFEDYNYEIFKDIIDCYVLSNEKGMSDKDVTRTVYYLSCNDDIRNMITVYKRSDKQTTKFNYIQEMHSEEETVNWFLYTHFHILPLGHVIQNYA